ncbi:DNA-directed RNA polymerase III subunit Rpc5, partial [Schizothecium vesticola]
DDDDPIVATYSLFTKPPLAENRQLIILQYVNKTASDPTQIRPLQIQDVRLKPKTGMFEVDVPLDTSVAYDQSKGIKWGSALQKSMETKKGGSLGLAGGFGIGAAVNRTGGGRRAAAEDEDLTWQEANRLDKVLRTQTLGGGRSAAEQSAGFMVGVFQGKNIHLTPITSIVNLRPIPHHLDAASEQDKLARPLPGGAAATAAAAKKNAANAIQMTLKGAMDDEGVATETMADRLRAVQAETWRTMEWYHDETEGAWQSYNECLFLSSGDADPDDKGKGKAVDAAPPPDSGLPELREKVARLETKWREDELLR